MCTTTAAVIGLDPGGRNSFGMARLDVERREEDGPWTPVEVSTRTRDNTAQVLAVLEDWRSEVGLLAVGIDTLAYWNKGRAGWRRADQALREAYPDVRNSVQTPYRLSGSMLMNGMLVLLDLRSKDRDLVVTETHPKVLWWQMAGQQWDYEANHAGMDARLADELGISLLTANDHEWDAAVSAYAAFMGLTGRWATDLVQLEDRWNCGDDVFPCGSVHYYWPEDVE